MRCQNDTCNAKAFYCIIYTVDRTGGRRTENRPLSCPGRRSIAMAFGKWAKKGKRLMTCRSAAEDNPESSRVPLWHRFGIAFTFCMPWENDKVLDLGTEQDNSIVAFAQDK